MGKEGRSDVYTAKWKVFRQRAGDTNPGNSFKNLKTEQRGTPDLFFFLRKIV